MNTDEHHHHGKGALVMLLEIMVTALGLAAIVAILTHRMPDIDGELPRLSISTIASRLVLLATAAVAFVLYPVQAFAQDIDPADTVATLELSAMLVTALIAAVIPILTGLVTKLSASATLKGLVTLVLNLVNAGIVRAVTEDGSAVWTQETLFAFVIGAVVSIASYLGIYREVETSQGKGINNVLAPNTGIG